MIDFATLKPMLLDERPMDLDALGWIWEIKFDGWRMLAQFGDGKCHLKTKGGADATKWFPEVSRSLAAVKGGPHIVDGEICVLDDMGRPDFNRMQVRGLRKRWYEGADVVTFCVFDLLVRGGKPIMDQPLLKRKAALGRLLKVVPPRVLLVSHFTPLDGIGRIFTERIVPLELEGLVGKRADSVYQPGVRSRDWVKYKRAGAVPAQRFRR
jgi:bifunctional non-homologous end joining protein LigD